MIQLKTGDFIDAKAITAIRVARATTRKEKERSGFSFQPRVLVDFNSSNTIIVNFQRLRDARQYAVDLHDEVVAELNKQSA